ncbi:MAG TPA: 2-dehydropantoate 2-reductase [Poseidonia sp.]|nr:2-dehydropantoate 2-reductase [Poseidonia sp.]
MRISILGVGSIGTLIAAFFAKTSHEIHLHVRGERGAMVMLQGLEVRGLMEANIPAERFLLSTEELEMPVSFENSSDVVILTCKAHEVAHLASMASSIVKDDGLVLALSNGLGHVETLSRIVGIGRTVAATTTHGAYRNADGEITWAGEGAVNLASMPLGPGPDAIEGLFRLFNAAGLNPVICSDAMQMIWEKVLLNITINPLAALAGLKNGELLESNVINGCMMVYREAKQVADLERVQLLDEIEFEHLLRTVLEATADNSCSMLEDIKAGRRTEISSLNREIANRAEQHGLSVPLNQVLASLIEACHPL